MAPFSTQEIFTTADAAAIAFTRWLAPRAGAPRLALIHSLALDRSVWDGVVEQLRGEAEILAYDCRGHGRSDRRAGTFTAESFARDLAELLDHVGWPCATVAGCSMGGCVALAFAGLYPARVEALGLMDTTARYGEDGRAGFRERATAAREEGMQGLVDLQAPRWFSDEFCVRHPAVVTHAADVFRATDVECYAASCGLLEDVDLRAHLPAFRLPVAIVVGEEDHATPVAMSQYLHEHIANSTLTVIPGARHLTPIEHPQKIAEELLALVRRT